MELVLPSLKYKESYLRALEEAKTDTRGATLQAPKENESFEDFVKHFSDEMKGLNLPEGYIPATMFQLVDDGEFIGRVQIRHELTEHLLKYGGHIGYYIRPSKRKMGYGKKILELALLKAKKMGFGKVLLTCDDNNLGSRKIIEASGGVLENIIEGEKEGEPKKRRYWIIIKNKFMAEIKKKIQSEYFEKVSSGKKRFELRAADFDIKEGDVLILEEWDPKTKEYTGKKIEKEVGYVLKFKLDDFGQQKEIEEKGLQIIQLEK